jgi:hypothetical protein
MPPRNLMQDRDFDDIDLFCYETMPTPEELYPLTSPSWPKQPAPPPGPPPSLVPFVSSSCFQQCEITDAVPCKHVSPLTKASKRKALDSPEPRGYSPGDENWVQHLSIWHPGDFTSSRVEMDADLPMRAIFEEVCFDLRIDRKQVRFVWRSMTKRHITLSDADAPWDVGMKADIDECVECEFV